MSWAITGTVVAGYLGSQATKKAGQAGQAGAQMSIDEQARQYDQTRQDQMPFLQAEYGRLAKLNELLGINTNQARLVGNGILNPDGSTSNMPNRQDFMTTTRVPGGYLYGGGNSWVNKQSFDEAGYVNAMDQWQNQAQQVQNQAGPQGPQSQDSGYLLQNFTGDDLQNEPGYQFGIQQGEQGIDRASRARGSFDSGATMKALLRFNQDYGGTKFNEGYNRDAANKSRIYAMLTGSPSSAAANQVAAAGQNAANQTSEYITQGANARMSGIVGGANAWSNAVGQGLQYNQNNNMLTWLNENSRQNQSVPQAKSTWAY